MVLRAGRLLASTAELSSASLAGVSRQPRTLAERTAVVDAVLLQLHCACPDRSFSVSAHRVVSGEPRDCLALLDWLACAEQHRPPEQEDSSEELLHALSSVTKLLAELRAAEQQPAEPVSRHWRPVTARSRDAAHPRRQLEDPLPRAPTPPPLPPPRAESTFSSVYSVRERRERAARVAAARAVYSAAAVLNLPPPPKPPPPVVHRRVAPKRRSILSLLPERTHGVAPRPWPARSPYEKDVTRRPRTAPC